jgi:hypothetical protein
MVSQPTSASKPIPDVDASPAPAGLRNSAKRSHGSVGHARAHSSLFRCELPGPTTVTPMCRRRLDADFLKSVRLSTDVGSVSSYA